MDYPVLNTDGWVEEGGKVADVVRSQVKSSPITEGLERNCAYKSRDYVIPGQLQVE